MKPGEPDRVILHLSFDSPREQRRRGFDPRSWDIRMRWALKMLLRGMSLKCTWKDFWDEADELRGDGEGI